MKYLLVADESGNPIYFDHPDGQMLCMVMATSFIHMKMNFECICRALCCGKTRFVLHQYETLVFLLVSDQGEPDSVLRSQLHLVYQLILLLFGPNNLHQRRRTLDRFKKTIQKLIDTTFHLLDTNQSILVQSIELLEVNKDILNKCMHSLKNVVANCPGATHALLFVGTKLLAWFFRPKSFQLSSMDMYLLILFFRGAFHPIIRELEFTKVHIADYTDHEEVIREATRQGTASSLLPTDSDIASLNTDLDDGVSMDEGFDTATEDWDDSFSVDAPMTIDVANPVHLLQRIYAYIYYESGWLDEIFDPLAFQQHNNNNNDTSSTTSSEDNMGMIPMNLTQSIRSEAAQNIIDSLRSGLLEGQINDGVAVLQHALFSLGLTPTNVVDGGGFGTITKQGVTAFQKMNNIPPTGDADAGTITTIIRRIRSHASPLIGSLSPLSYLSPPLSPDLSPNDSPGLSAEKLALLDRSRTENNNNNNNNNSTFNRERSRTQINNRSARNSSANLSSSRRTNSSILDIPPGYFNNTTPKRSPSSQFNDENSNNNNLSSSSPASSRPPSRAEETPPPSRNETPIPTTTTTNTNNSNKTSTSSSSSTGKEKEGIKKDATVFEQLYLRIPTHMPMWVYCSELQEITTLVVISKGLTGTKEERERLDKSRDQIRYWLKKNYASYLLAKERTHLPILPHLPHLPGLVHYIFVDRTTNRVRAPTISPLHGQQAQRNDARATQRMVATLRAQMRTCVHTAQDHLAMGYTAMLVRRKDFLYSYRLWVEDDEGVEQVIEQSIPTNENLHRTPLGHRFYKELLRWLFPSQSQQMKCYELYTLYLGILPAALVSKNDRALIAMLLERDVD